MIKSKVSIERVRDERHYQFVVPSEAPLAEVLAVAEDIRSWVVERIRQEEAKAAESAEAPKEVPVVEPEVIAE